MTYALEATGLGKRYGRTWGLRDCSLSIPSGHVAALVGPNGAGKTTLLKLAVGLLRPNAGAIRTFGVTPREDLSALGRIGFVGQDTPLYADFTVAELLIMGEKLNPRWDQGGAEGRLRRLSILLDRKVSRLSGGQRAQVALTLALAKQPELLVLDEPVASLDPLARKDFLAALMGSVAERGLTVILSSHLIADLEHRCDYLIVLSESRVQVLGQVDDLLSHHKTLVGPRRDDEHVAGVDVVVVQASHTNRQTTMLVRSDSAITDSSWTVHAVALEDLVLAYLAEPSAGMLPGPRRAGVQH
jgi:ABC-2 type transport system ATP-binding protein